MVLFCYENIICETAIICMEQYISKYCEEFFPFTFNSFINNHISSMQMSFLYCQSYAAKVQACMKNWLEKNTYFYAHL